MTRLWVRFPEDIQGAIPTDFNVNANLNNLSASNTTKANAASSGFTLHIDNFINNTEKDIEQLAYEFEFYRQTIILCKGWCIMLSFVFNGKETVMRILEY